MKNFKNYLLLILGLVCFLANDSYAVSYGSLLGQGGDGPRQFQNFASFPASANDGELAMDQSAGALYVWFTGMWNPIATPATVTSVGAINGQPKNANAATIAANVFYQQTADATWPGVLTAADWSTFNSKVSSTRAINTTAPLTGGGDLSADRTIAIPQATSLVDGYLDNADWSTFNNKEPSITATTAADYYRGDKTFQTLNGLAVANTPAGNISATDVQAAINELDSEKQATGNYITALTGDVTASGPGSVAATIANNSVSDAKLRDSAALSVIGRSVNSAGDPADIAAGADFNVLRRSGVTIGFGSIDLSQSGAVGASVLPVANGGTNSSTALNNNRVMQSSGGAVVEAAAITASRALISDANGIPTHSATTSTELGYVSGVTSAIQTQINGKQAAFTDIQEIPAGLVNNSNVTFTLSQTPISDASVALYHNGLILDQGVDYTIVGAIITMIVAPNFAEKLYAVYKY